MFKSITNIITNYIYLAVLKRLDVENLRNVLAVAIAAAQEKAAETSNKIDDWILEALANFINDDAKMQVVVDWIRGKISGNICEAECCHIGADGKMHCNEYEALAAEALAKESEPCGTVEVLAIVTQILEVVLPVIIEWWKEQNHSFE